MLSKQTLTMAAVLSLAGAAQAAETRPMKCFARSVFPATIVGYILGRHADALEYRADAPRRRLDLYFFEVLPRLYGQFLAYVLYRREIILRERAISPMQSEAASSLRSTWRSSRAIGVKPANEPH